LCDLEAFIAKLSDEHAAFKRSRARETEPTSLLVSSANSKEVLGITWMSYSRSKGNVVFYGYHGFQHLEVQAIAFLMDSPFGHWLMAV